MRLFLTMALLAQVWAGSAQVYFNKQIDWQQNEDVLGYIVATGDYRNFLAAGGSLSLDPYLDQLLITRFDSLGEPQGAKVHLPSGSNFGSARDAVQLDGQYSLIMGSFYTFANGIENGQIFLIKINTLTGDTVWTKQYGKPDWHDFGRSMIKTIDGGFAIVGKTFQANNQPPEKILLIKIDSNWNQVFRREYSTNSGNNHSGWAIEETCDSGFILSCIMGYQGVCLGCLTSDFMNDFLVIKTDGLGNQQWVRKFTPWEWKQYSWGGYDIKPLQDSTYIIFGNKYYYIYNQTFTYYSRYMLFRFGNDGVLLDFTSFGGGAGTLVTSAIQTKDHNFLVTAAENDSSFSGIGQTGVLLKISPSLQLLWKKEYHISPPEVKLYEKFFDAIELPDKSFIVCGRAFEDCTNSNGWILRVDSLGCLEPGCQLNSAIEDPPAPEQDIGISLSPNPTTGQARLALTHEGAVLLSVRVLDMQSRVVSDMQYLRSAGWREVDIDLSQQLSGIYIVQVRTSEGAGARKVIKQ
ncbi:MAG: T9SS type A sorting domain-containing protein [Saprospiraceae bacterium]